MKLSGNRWVAGATLAALLVAGGWVWWLQQPAAAATTAEGPRTITVKGSGDVLARPDMATASLGVEMGGATAQEAMAKASEQMNKVLAAVRAAGIPDDDIATTNFSLRPEYDRASPPNVVGYRATNGATVQVRDLNKLVWVLDAAVAAGASYTGGIAFGFNNDDDLRQRALRAAVRNARAKADALADAMGVTVTTVHSVSETGVTFPPPMPVGGARAPDATAPVQPGTQAITGAVTATFVIQ